MNTHPFYFFATKKGVFVPRELYADDIQQTVSAGADAGKLLRKPAFVMHRRMPELSGHGHRVPAATEHLLTLQ